MYFFVHLEEQFRDTTPFQLLYSTPFFVNSQETILIGMTFMIQLILTVQ